METKYYAVNGCSLMLSLTTHPGTLTREDVMENLVKAMKVSVEFGEDWKADIEGIWYQRSGMIELTPDEILEDEDEMWSMAKDLTNVWDVDGSRADWLLKTAGKGEELLPLDDEQKEQLDEMENWSMFTLLCEAFPPQDSPYY
jgi:hypothetical protein